MTDESVQWRETKLRFVRCKKVTLCPAIKLIGLSNKITRRINGTYPAQCIARANTIAGVF
jgi:hypothetical protein